jgi:hypothetical protein
MAIPVEEAIAALSTFSLEVGNSGLAPTLNPRACPYFAPDLAALGNPARNVALSHLLQL